MDMNTGPCSSLFPSSKKSVCGVPKSPSPLSYLQWVPELVQRGHRTGKARPASAGVTDDLKSGFLPCSIPHKFVFLDIFHFVRIFLSCPYTHRPIYSYLNNNARLKKKKTLPDRGQEGKACGLEVKMPVYHLWVSGLDAQPCPATADPVTWQWWQRSSSSCPPQGRMDQVPDSWLQPGAAQQTMQGLGEYISSWYLSVCF